MKIWFTILALLSALTINATKFDGTWSSDKVELTFNKDTLIIDEIGVEGNVYTFVLDSLNDVILAKDIFNDYIYIKLVEFTNDEMYICYLDDEMRDVYCFKRKK